MVRCISVMILASLLAACDPPGSGSGGATPTPSAAPTPPVPPATASATASASARIGGARKVTEETDDYLFEYAYPAAAGNIDALGDLLDARLEKTRSELARDSAKARDDAREDGFPYNKHSFQGTWMLVAAIPGYVSLSQEFATYTGGAHGNYGVESLIWDIKANRALNGIDLFTSPAALEQALGKRYCEGLDRERRKKGIHLPEEGGVFPKCPKIGELTVLVGSSNKQHFNRLTLYAGPYVAGAYAEGDYQVNLNVDGKVLAAVKPEYRDSFRTRN